LRRSLRGSSHPRQTKTRLFSSNTEVYDLCQVAAGEQFRSTFSGTPNAEVGGSTTGTLFGTGAIVANQLDTGVSGGVTYPTTGNYSPNVGTIRFKFIPSFTGFPPNAFNIIWDQALTTAAGNRLQLNWGGTGVIGMFISDFSGLDCKNAGLVSIIWKNYF